jgi:hypothetical protein
MAIQIDGLTQNQVEMLEVIWSFKTAQEFLDWQSSLSSVDHHQSYLLLTLLSLEMIDEKTMDPCFDLSQAKNILQKIAKKA